jgi:hypothetical protein
LTIRLIVAVASGCSVTGEGAVFVGWGETVSVTGISVVSNSDSVTLGVAVFGLLSGVANNVGSGSLPDSKVDTVSVASIGVVMVSAGPQPELTRNTIVMTASSQMRRNSINLLEDKLVMI